MAEEISMLEYSQAVPVLQQLLSANGPTEITEEVSRRARQNLVDIPALKATGDLQPGQTYIGVRLIAQNIATALPPLLSYIKNSPRMATFSPGDNSYLDQEFTRVLQYPMWEVPYIQVLDSAEQNGMGFMLVRNDESKVGNVAFEYANYSDVVYDRRVEDLQDSPAILIRHRITRVAFFDWDAKEGFNKESQAYQAVVKMLFDPTLGQNDVAIYEMYTKVKGFVYRGWYYNTGGDWLLTPSEFSNGVMVETPQLDIDPANPAIMGAVPTVPKPATRVDYPVVPKYYEITSNMRNEWLKGRGELDYAKQEAASQMFTSTINGSLAASNTMWAPDGNNIDGGAPAQLELKIKNNAIWKTPMKAFNAPYPDPMLLRTVETIVAQNAQENNQVAWAVNNRKDTRKTAAEIEAAEAQQQQLTGTAALVFSIFLRQLFTQAWPIVKSAALFGKIQFLPEMDPETRKITLEKQYEIKPAGDVDFIEKQQRLNNIQQDIPLFAGTPLESALRSEYIRLRYPEKFNLWGAMIAQNDVGKQLVEALSGALQEAVTTPDGQLKPEFQPEAQNLEMLKQNVTQYLQPPAPPK
jgi:hypothetical protein